MNYSEIKFYDISNGEGVRTSLFVSGCTNRCQGCFNPQTWDFEYGKEFDEDARKRILDSVSKEYIRGISILGGDPMHPRNQKEVFSFMKEFKDKFPNKTIWVWTGYNLYSDLLNENSEVRTEVTDGILNLLDVIVDGKFCEGLKNPSLRFRGSSNQKIYKSLGDLKFEVIE